MKSLRVQFLAAAFSGTALLSIAVAAAVQVDTPAAQALQEDIRRIAAQAAAVKAPEAPADLLPERLPPTGSPKIERGREAVFAALNASAEQAFTQRRFLFAAEMLRQAHALASEDDMGQFRYTIALWQASKRQQARASLRALASSMDAAISHDAGEALRRLDSLAKEQEFAGLTAVAAKDITSGDYSTAAQHLEQAAALFPDRSEAVLRAATLLTASGQSKRGEELLARLSADVDKAVAVLATARLERVHAATAAAAAAATAVAEEQKRIAANKAVDALTEQTVTALVPTTPRPGAWSEWKKIPAKQAGVEYRIKTDAQEKDSFGQPAAIQFRNTSAQRMEYELQVIYTQPSDFAPGPNDYIMAIKLSPGEESKEKFIGSIQKIDSVKLLRADVLEGGSAAGGTKSAASGTVSEGATADAIVRKAKLEALRKQLVEDSKRVAAKYSQLAAQDSERRAAYQKRIGALTGFAQTLQNSVIDNQSRSLLFNPTGSGMQGQAYLSNSPYGQFNNLMRQFNPAGAEIAAYFDVARAMSAYNLDQQEMLNKLESNVQIISGVINLFRKKRDPAEERRVAMAKMKKRQEYLDRMRAGYEQAQKNATPATDDLISMAAAGDIDGVHAALEVVPEAQRKAFLNSAASNGDTALHAAAAAGELTMLRELAQMGANINASDPEGRTPLYRATETGQADAIVVCASLGGSPKQLPAGDMSYIRAMAESQGVRATDGKKIGEIASKRYPDPILAVELAKIRKDKRCVAALEGKYKLASPPKDSAKINSLVKSGNVSALVKVVEDRNPNTRDELGWTPLHHAAAAGQSEVIATLVEARANLSALTRTGRTPLTLAVEKDQPLAVAALIRAGASPKARDGSGDSAVSLAKLLDRPAIALLLEDANTNGK